MLVLIKGAGDLATGTAVRLYRAGIPVVMTEVAQPTAVRRTVAFSQCMYDGAAQVEGISARRAEDAGAARRALERGEVPVLCDPEAAILMELPLTGWWTPSWPSATWARPLPTRRWCWPWGPASPPGWTATAWWRPCGGTIWAACSPGERRPQHRRPRRCGGLHHPAHHPRPGGRGVRAAGRHRPAGGGGPAGGPGGGPDGLRPAHRRGAGMLPAGLAVTAGMKAGDIDPRCRAEHCFTVSDKARAIGGGVLEGLLYFGRRAGLWSV